MPVNINLDPCNTINLSLFSIIFQIIPSTKYNNRPFFVINEKFAEDRIFAPISNREMEYHFILKTYPFDRINCIECYYSTVIGYLNNYRELRSQLATSKIRFNREGNRSLRRARIILEEIHEKRESLWQTRQTFRCDNLQPWHRFPCAENLLQPSPIPNPIRQTPRSTSSFPCIAKYPRTCYTCTKSPPPPRILVSLLFLPSRARTSPLLSNLSLLEDVNTGS